MSGRPDHWPEWFTSSSPACFHYMQWDSADEVYRCINCGNERITPPDDETKVTLNDE